MALGILGNDKFAKYLYITCGYIVVLPSKMAGIELDSIFAREAN